MHILRGIRTMMVRLITRATRYHELCATCFPRGGVPTMFTTEAVNVGRETKINARSYRLVDNF